MKTYRQFISYIETVSNKIIQNNDTLESCIDQTWDNARDADCVIYYGKAFDLIDVVRRNENSLLDDAIEEVENNEASDTSNFWNHCTRISYHLVRLSLERKVSESYEKRQKEIKEEKYKKEERSFAVKCRHYAKRLGVYIQKDWLHHYDEFPAYQLGWDDSHPQRSLLDEWEEDTGDNHPADWHDCYRLLEDVEDLLQAKVCSV